MHRRRKRRGRGREPRPFPFPPFRPPSNHQSRGAACRSSAGERPDTGPVRSTSRSSQRPRTRSRGQPAAKAADRPGAAHAPGEQRTREKPRQDRRPRRSEPADRRPGGRADQPGAGPIWTDRPTRTATGRSDPQQPEAAQIAEARQPSAEPPAVRPVRLPALKGHHQNKKERLQGHSPRKDTATAHL